jgi:hypothetical protein
MKCGAGLRLLAVSGLVAGLACPSCSNNSAVSDPAKPVLPSPLQGDVKFPATQLPTATGPALETPLGTALSQALAKRVEFGPKSGVFLEVARDPVDAANVLATPVTVAGALAGNGASSGWLCLPLVCRPTVAGGKKRVVIPATVCLRSGYLEHLLSHGGKRHESVLFADVDASIIHAALLAAGATPGKPVQFENLELKRDFRPATGQPIRITLQYEGNGSRKTVPAQKWIRYAKTKKELGHDWVFAGSYTFKDPDGNTIYAANEGRFICVTNFSNAMLDVPFQSQDGDPQNGLDFEANTEAIPPPETPVLVFLEPLGAAASAPKK